MLAARRPAVVLREPTEYAGLLAAERLAVPHGRIAIMAHAMERWSVPVVAPVLDGHRERLGTRYDPLGRQITRAPYLTVVPEAMEDPADTGPAHALRFREEPPAARPLPAWWGDDDRPLVYATYGSVVPTLPGFEPLFRATAAALGALPVRALFTVGNDVDLEALGPVAANVHVERWVPQADVMPHAAAMITHGGAGTTRMALAAGVPAVIVPAIADQPRNAGRVEELGAGIGFGGAEQAMRGLEDAVRRLIEEPSYRAAARRVADEVAALPPVSAAAAALTGWLRPARAA
jgi:UDP:flavonoid glycosyltransferase YjiC (YdhE family)